MKSKFIYVVILLIAIISLLSSCTKFPDASWEVIDLNYTGSLSDIYTISGDTLFILSTLDDTYQNTCIFESDDAGATWTQKCFPKLYPGGFYNFYCLNHLKIYATGGALFRSDDGGLNWQQINEGGGLLHFFNNNEGLRMSGQSIYKTLDGGNSYRTVYSHEGFGGFSFIQLFDDKVGYTSGGSYQANVGSLLKTTDRGETWYSPSNISNCVLGMSFISKDIGYIIVKFTEGNISGGELLKTIDGAKTWKSINKIYEGDAIVPRQCYFFDEHHGFIKGTDIVSKILSTNNGGKSWQIEYKGKSVDYLINKMIFTSTGIGFAIGDNGLLLKRTIY
jgi:photosystem II stability/assembly factor-like uncharacterized protein